MNKLIFSCLLLFSFGVNGQTDTSAIKFIEPPDSTGFGISDGKLVSKLIGPAGGSMAADDGRVELIFPAGALTANTNISIQPITNKLNGSGKAIS